MRPIWNGTISFGLVAIPVRLYAATETKDVTFRQVHAADGGRIRYQRICELDGEEVPYSDIARGYELPGGSMVVLDDEDMAHLPLGSSKAIDVLEFVPTDQIDPLLYNKAYYAEPDKSGAKPYVLMRDTLASSDRVAVVKVTLRRREALAVLRPQGDILIVQTLLWPEEVRDAEPLAPHGDVRVRKQELAMASSYIDTLTTDFEPDQFTDDYRAAVEQLVAAKTEGGEVAEPSRPAPADGGVIDLMDALRASIKNARQQRGASQDAEKQDAGKRGATKKVAVVNRAARKASVDQPDEQSGTASKRAAAKRTPAKKAPAKQSAVKQTPVKQAPVKQSPVKQGAAARKAAKKAPAKKTASRRTA
jgi:DNA end-binding protein Ku